MQKGNYKVTIELTIVEDTKDKDVDDAIADALYSIGITEFDIGEYKEDK